MIPTDPPVSYSPLLVLERRRLLKVLRALDPSDWERPTPCPGWNILGLCSHLLGDDLSYLSWQRDDHRGTVPPAGLDEAGFVEWLDQLQNEWVQSARRLSPQLVVQMLDWTNDQVADTVAGQDPSSMSAHVSWAGDDVVPLWLDQARELSERWVHRQQVLQSLGRPTDLRSDLARPVLDGLRWAYPFRLGGVDRPGGTTVRISVVGNGLDADWSLLTNGGVWSFTPVPADQRADAELSMTAEQAWRQLTNNADRDSHGEVAAVGDPTIVDVLLKTRAIIGMPK